MTMSRIALFVVPVAAALATQSASAHHSVAAEFDTSLQGELTGEITQVWYRNPHIRYRLTVAGEDGSTEDWELQAGNVTNLRRSGWYEDSLQVGDMITASGDFGRNGAKKLRIQEIRNATGVIYPPTTAEPRSERNVVNASADRYYGFGETTRRPIDITGPWRNSYQWHVTVDDLEPKPTPFTAEGKRLFESTEPWHDPALRCVAMGLPRIFGSPYNMTVVDAGNHYLFVYVEHNVPRRVWMDGREAPANTPPTSMGFSSGRWEGDELVIETTHLSSGWLDGSGLPMSGDGTQIVERYAFSEDRLTVDRKMTIYDPYYTEPLVRQRYSARDDNIDYAEQAPCDPDSYYRDLSSSGRLEDHFNR
jgi:hypothetical protein